MLILNATLLMEENACRDIGIIAIDVERVFSCSLGQQSLRHYSCLQGHHFLATPQGKVRWT